MVKIIDRYILYSFFGPLAFGVLAFTAIFIGSDLLFTLINLLVDGRLTIFEIFRIVFLSLPEIVSLTLPMGILFGSLLSFSKLSDSGEVTAMLTGGISYIRLFVPVIMAAFLISLFAIYLNESIVPWASWEKENIIREARGQRPLDIQRNVVVKNFSAGAISQIVYAGTFDMSENRLYDVTVQDFEGERLARVTEAEEVTWANESWHFYSGRTYVFTNEDMAVLNFDKQNIYLEKTPEQMQAAAKGINEMTVSELREEIREIESYGGDASRVIVELHMRFSLPMAGFIFALVGAPLGVKRQRKGTSYGFGLSIVIIFIYYIVITISTTFAQEGAIPPMVGPWFPNVLFAGVGLGLIFKTSR